MAKIPSQAPSGLPFQPNFLHEQNLLMFPVKPQCVWWLLPCLSQLAFHCQGVMRNLLGAPEGSSCSRAELQVLDSGFRWFSGRA